MIISITIFHHHHDEQAMSEYRGRRGEDLALNHFINSIVVEQEVLMRTKVMMMMMVMRMIEMMMMIMMMTMITQVGDRLSSLVTGSPPIWVTKRSGWLYFRWRDNYPDA